MYALREEGDITAALLLLPLANFYPRPPRGGRLGIGTRIVEVQVISTHALRGEGDVASGWPEHCTGISIHALREEGDLPDRQQRWYPDEFLSTPSARRATAPTCARASAWAYFYPRPPRGGRLRSPISTSRLSDFYPRPPRGGRPFFSSGGLSIGVFLSTPSARRATFNATLHQQVVIFLSTPSARRATRITEELHTVLLISIHALREEGDGICSTGTTTRRYFYPRPPRGGRLLEAVNCAQLSLFLSTPSARRATQVLYSFVASSMIFLSTPSARRATAYRDGRCLRLEKFLSTPSARRATSKSGISAPPSRIFLSTPSARRATVNAANAGTIAIISIHALREEGDDGKMCNFKRA